MSRYWSDVAQATAVVGYNLLKDKAWRIAPFPRSLLRVGFTGSAAIGDCDAEVRVGGAVIGTINNTKLGMASNQDDMLNLLSAIPANLEIEIVVTTAPTTNPVCVMLEFSP